MLNTYILLLIFFFVALSFSLNVINVVDYGAVGDGVTKNTQAINKAIQACASQNGCQLLFPKGKYLTGSFNLTSNMILNITHRAEILASEDESDYPIIKPLPSYCQGRELNGPRYAPVIGGNNLTNVVITGKGKIDGQGKIWWEKHGNGTLKYTRGRLLEFQNCKDFIIEDVHLKDSPFWTLHPYSCNNVLIQRVKITAPPNSPNTDGVDPDSSSNVIVRDCTIATGDDNISVKSGLNYCGRQYNQPSYNIIVENNYFPWGHGLAIGSESSGGVRDVIFRGNSIGPDISSAAHIKTERGRGGYIKNITFENFQSLGASNFVYVTMNYTGQNTPPTNATGTPIVTGITVKDARGFALNAYEFDCLPESNCEVNLENLEITHFKTQTKCNNVYGNVTNVNPSPCYNSDSTSISFN